MISHFLLLHRCTNRVYLEGEFKVVSVPPVHILKFLIRMSPPSFFLREIRPQRSGEQQVTEAVAEKKLVDKESISRERAAPEVSMTVKIHAETNLLAYHLQRPHTNLYRYFGGSKLSFQACATVASFPTSSTLHQRLPRQNPFMMVLYFPVAIHGTTYISISCEKGND